MKYLIVLIINVLYVQCESDHYLPSYITPCDYAGQFGDCIKEQIQNAIPYFAKGIPELDVQSLDPLHMDDIKNDGNGLALTLTNVVMEGLGTSKVLAFDIDLEKEEYRLVTYSNVTINAQYKIDGKILILPIIGEGNAKIDLHGSELDFRAKLTHIKGKSEEHFKQTSIEYKHKAKNVKFDFSNLFNGNKQLAETTIKFANDNWREIMDDLAAPVIKQIVKTSTKAINKFFSKVPISRMIKGYNKDIKKIRY